MNASPEFLASRPVDLLRARIAVSIAFFLAGTGTGLWAVHIPLVRERLGIDSAMLGFALFAMAVGSVLTMPLTGWSLGRFGSRLPTAVLTFAFVVVTPLLISAGSVPILFLACALFGASLGGLDVAMNTQASEIETARGRPIMSSFHGFFSVGGLVGALLGGAIIAVGWGDGSGAAIAALAFLVFAVYSARHLLPSERPISVGPRFALPSRAVIGLGMIAFLSFAIEGAIADWSALYLSTVKQATAAAAATGFAMFSCAMAGCRLAGDVFVARFGQRLTLTLGGGLITLGLAIAILAPWALVGGLGFALVGIGAANIVPVIFSAGPRVPGVAPGMAVATIATLGYSGFLVAPPLIGVVAKAYGLSSGLWLVALGGLIVAAVAALRR